MSWCSFTTQPGTALANSSAMAGFMKQSEMQQFAGFAAFFEGVSRRLRGEQEAGLAEMERAAEQLRNQGVLNLRSFFKAIRPSEGK
jgi:hypothetical protein